MYFTDSSRLEDEKVCAYLLANKDAIVEEGQFRLTNGLTVFAFEIHAIKQVISNALRKNPGELDIFSNSKTVLQELYSLVP